MAELRWVYADDAQATFAWEEGATDKGVTVEYQTPRRRVPIGTFCLDDGLTYHVCWGADGDQDKIIVIRMRDGRIAGKRKIDPERFQAMTYGQWMEDVMRFVQKVAAADRVGGLKPSADGKAWAEKYPAIWEYLTTQEYDGGKTRVTSTLNLSFSEGMIKAALNDRDNERTLWVAGPSVPDVLEALEGHLTSGTGDWRPNKPWTPGKRRK